MSMNKIKIPVKQGVLLLYFICLGLLLYLGYWQLERGSEKARVEQKISAARGQVSQVQARPQNWAELNYQNIELSGQWDYAHTFLLNSRIYKGVSGVEVLTPFILEGDGSILLVNRGWVAKAGLAELGDIDSGNKITVVSGQIYQPSKGYTIGPSFTDTTTWPVTIEYIDHAAISELIEHDMELSVLVMDSGPGAFTRIWKPYVVNAQRHYGYTVQWWGLAIVFIVFGLIWRRSAKNSNDSRENE
jgi:surfeit locus 1 family protein